MFGYVRPNKSELLVKEYDQYKAAYCELCRELGRSFGFLSRLALTYDCTFYALLALSVEGSGVCEERKACVVNPLKKCSYLKTAGEAYKKAAALSVSATYYKLLDNAEDEGFFKALGCRIGAFFFRRKVKKAEKMYPFITEAAREMSQGQTAAEKAADYSADSCAEPTAKLLQTLCKELSKDEGQKLALSSFGYYLGRWVYLMDASDDLEKDLRAGAFNPLARLFGLEGEKTVPPQRRRETEEGCNAMLNANIAKMIPALNLVKMKNFGAIIENIVQKGLPEMQREILFLHIGRKEREERDRELGD